MRPLIHSLAALFAVTPLIAQTVLVAPYVQPGDGATLAGADVKSLVWFTDQTPGAFTVEYGVAGKPWRSATVVKIALDFGLPPKKPAPTPAPAANPAADAPTTLEDLKMEAAASSSVPFVEKEQHYFRYVADLAGLPFDSSIGYRVKLGAKLVREGAFKTRASATKAIHFVAVGDMATGKAQQNGIAWQIAQQKPDFMIALGDIVYSAGRTNQYMHHFFPTYNDVAEPGEKTGAPIMASTPIYPVIGNHDIEVARLSVFPDAWGAFYFFRVPQSGPGAGAWTPAPSSKKDIDAKFRATAGTQFPAMLCYSWDDGPAHFMALDCGAHVKADEP
ncbi:MAG: metallophosphoesterase, partial [Chthoniobacteraceae bacterium]